MEQNLQRNIVWFFLFIVMVTFVGFFPTYLITAPKFEGFKSAHHFHGLMALSWILLLVIQPYLIRSKKFALHKKVGKISYLLMPLLLLSLFLVAKAGYERGLVNLTQKETLAGLVSGLPDIIYLGFLYTMAMVYRKNAGIHMRFMACTGFMMLGPGLGRLLIIFFGLPVHGAIITIVLIISILPLIWLIFDIRNKKPIFPLVSYLIISIVTVFIIANSNSAWWQTFAGWFSNNFF